MEKLEPNRREREGTATIKELPSNSENRGNCHDRSEYHFGGITNQEIKGISATSRDQEKKDYTE